jgi:hypothetical protein
MLDERIRPPEREIGSIPDIVRSRAGLRDGEGHLMAKCALVCGAGGFIGGHLVKRLKRDGLLVRGVDLNFPEFSETEADDFVIGDLRSQDICRLIVDRRFDEVYQ